MIEDLKEAVGFIELMMGIQTDKSQEKRFSEEVLKEHIKEHLKDQVFAKFHRKWLGFSEIGRRYICRY